MRTRVRDMPRQQQKAVFARKTDDGYLASLQGAEAYQRRRNYLIKRNELSETYEDKIFRVYSSRKLTHRQKMAKISQLKKEAAKKLRKHQAEESGSTTGEIREENWRKFKREYDIVEVPIQKGKPISFERGNIARAEREVIKKKLEKKKGVISPHAIATKIVQEGGRSSSRKAVQKEHKRQIKKAGLEKGMTWKQVKAKHRKANPDADYDLDKVKNKEDCKPMDKKKQDKDITEKVAKAAGKAYAAYQKSRTPKARIKKAKEKLAKIKRKEKAEQLEKEAKTAEAEYRKAHPKKFGIF